ncbi:MAG: hypothetical protein OXC80_06400 [Gammaproteobacteria bacterium]|nr:hypothetical protein [Gammaproteobacteria bacterium]
MSKLRNVSLVVIFLLGGGCATQGYEPFMVKGFEELTSNHSTVAILPFDMSILDTNLDDQSVKDRGAYEQQEGNAYQQSLYASLLTQSREKDYRVTFQDVATTNSKLKDAAIVYRHFNSSYTKSELCSLLGVDAVISGFISLSQPRDDVAVIKSAIQKAAISSATKDILGSTLIEGQPDTTRVTVTVAAMLYDKESDGALWRYIRNRDAKIGSEAKEMIETLVGDIDRVFPYAQTKGEEN